MRNISYWELESYFKNIDDLVVGGGIVGLSTAVYLKMKFPARRVVVVERDAFSAGASTKNAGFACFGSPSEIASDLVKMSEADVISLIRFRFEGLKALRSLLGDDAIGYKPCGGFELFRDSDHELFEKCLYNLEVYNHIAMEAIGAKAYSRVQQMPEFSGRNKFIGGIYNQLEGSIHTGKMMRSLKERCNGLGVEFFNGLNVEEIHLNGDKVVVNIEGIEIKPRRVFVCINGFAKKLLPSLEVTAVRNQVLVTSKLRRPILESTYHVDEGYIYFRPIDDRLLIGGFRNTDKENETTSEFGITSFIQEKIEDFIVNYITSEKITIDYRWSGILGVGETKVPIVERYNENVFVGVRMGGMGIAIGNLIGKKLSELAD
jgi:glycine/D-amino acid oxidase-like deaminating enzyme